MKTAIFLGAGASAADGAPVQSDLFKKYFEESGPSEIKRDLAVFFNYMFDINVQENNFDSIQFPTFEEVLGVLDLADLKNETFRDLSNNSADGHNEKIKTLRLYFVHLLAKVLDETLSRPKGHHRELIDNLRKNDILKQCLFLTSNYDLLCDKALGISKIDYGVDFIEPRRRNRNKLKLFKLHGSLNWLHCSTCNHLKLTDEKNIPTFSDSSTLDCEICNTRYSPVIVPPTFYKDFSKVFLNQIWNEAERELLTVEHLIFCGYSFPDADLHVKYLLKRIQKNRSPDKSLKITVINHYADKNTGVIEKEKQRYRRFLGMKIDFTDKCFEDFAKSPESIITCDK